jgi:uncharacterized membrane protein
MTRGIIFTLLLFLLNIRYTLGQTQTNTNWLENTMYSSGKINVVITVLVIAFLGLVIFLFSIEKRLRQAENKDNK